MPLLRGGLASRTLTRPRQNRPRAGIWVQSCDVIGQDDLCYRAITLRWLHPILLHRRLGHLDAHLPQFPHNPGRAPRGIRLPHVSNQLAHFFGYGRAPGLTLLAQLPPVVAKALVLPGNDRAGVNERQGAVPL